MNPIRVVQRATRTAAAQRVRPDKDRHWASVAGDRNFFTILDTGQQFGQRSPRLRGG